MKLLRRKKEEPTRRHVAETPSSSSSAPIVRYYRPQSQSRGSNDSRQVSNFKRTDGDTKKSNSRVLKNAGKIVSQWLVLGMIVGLLVVNVTLSGTSVRVKGSTYAYRSIEQYQAIINNIVSSRMTFRTKATLSSSTLEAEIKRQLPEVENASAIIPLAGRKLQIVLDVAGPLVRLQTGTNKLAVVSAGGIVTKEDNAESVNAVFSDLPSLSMVGVTPQVGSQILTQNESGLIKLLTQEFDGSDSSRPRVQSLEFDVSKREIKLRFKDVVYYAKITPEEEGRVQVGALHKTIQSLQEQGPLPSEYIDVRVEDRVFVR